MPTEDSLDAVSLSGQAVVHQAEPSLLLKAMEALLHASPDPVYIVDRQGRYLYVGEAGARALGRPASEIVGKTTADWGLAPEVAADLIARIEQVFQTKQPLTGTTLIPTSTGLRLHEHHFTPLLDDQGEVTAMLWMAKVVTDLSERRQQEVEIATLNRDLQRRLQEIETIFQTVPAALNIADDIACRHMRGNPATYRMLRLPEGANFSKTGPPDEIPPFRVYRDGQEILDVDLPMQIAARSGQEVRDVELDIVWEDGVACRWYGGASPLFDEQGATRGSVGAFVDITHLKAAQEEIVRLNERLHRAVYEASHRIKNQLQVLTAMADMTLMDGQEIVSVEEFRRLRSQIGAVAATHDILTQETKADGTADHISLNALLERTLTALKRTTDRHRLTYTLDDVLVSLKAATSLALIVNETVSNAIKHGGGKVEVMLVVAEGQGRLEVCDDGPGFPEGFDAPHAANTGLELLMTLTRTDLGGTVEFANRAEGGAQVVVTFPVLAES